jgi:hypothetical protein
MLRSSVRGLVLVRGHRSSTTIQTTHRTSICTRRRKYHARRRSSKRKLCRHLRKLLRNLLRNLLHHFNITRLYLRRRRRNRNRRTHLWRDPWGFTQNQRPDEGEDEDLDDFLSQPPPDELNEEEELAPEMYEAEEDTEDIIETSAEPAL